MPELNRRGEDLGFEDFALDVMFGGVLGAGFGGMSAAAGDFIRARRQGGINPEQGDGDIFDIPDSARIQDTRPFDDTPDSFLAGSFDNGQGAPDTTPFDSSPDNFLADSFDTPDSARIQDAVPFMDDSLNQEVLHGLFVAHGMDVDEANALVPKIFEGMKQQRLSDDNVHELSAAMRARIGGDTRTRMGLFLEDLLTQLSKNNADSIDYVALAEKYNMGEVYDKIYREIINREVTRLEADEVLLVLRPDGEEPLVLERGPSIDGRDGALPLVRGKRVGSATGSRNGYGMVKILVKHGEFSDENPKLQVTRADMMRIPQILREYEPHLNEKGNRTWVVERTDGTQLVIGAGGMADGGSRIVTAYISKKGFEKALSLRKALTKSHSGGNQPTRMDTAEGTFPRDTPESAKASHVSGNTVADTRNIGLLEQDVKIKDTDELLDYGLESEAQRLVDEGKVSPEILQELSSIDAEAARLESLERSAMGIVNCVWKGK